MSRRYGISVSLMIFFLFCLLPVKVNAQLDKGLLVGWNGSDWDYHPAWSSKDLFEPKNGFCAGGYLGGKVAGHLGWRGEILYTRKGAVMKAMGTDENGEPMGEIRFFHNVDYLEIPFLFSLTIPTGGAVRPVFYLGPAVDFELSAKTHAEYPSGVQNDFNADETLTTSKSTDFSLIFGGGIDIDAGGKVISLQVRYVMGTQEVYLTAKNKTLSVMAGFGI